MDARPQVARSVQGQSEQVMKELSLHHPHEDWDKFRLELPWVAAKALSGHPLPSLLTMCIRVVYHIGHVQANLYNIDVVPDHLHDHFHPHKHTEVYTGNWMLRKVGGRFDRPVETVEVSQCICGMTTTSRKVYDPYSKKCIKFQTAYVEY